MANAVAVSTLMNNHYCFKSKYLFWVLYDEGRNNLCLNVGLWQDLLQGRFLHRGLLLLLLAWWLRLGGVSTLEHARVRVENPVNPSLLRILF